MVKTVLIQKEILVISSLFFMTLSSCIGYSQSSSADFQNIQNDIIINYDKKMKDFKKEYYENQIVSGKYTKKEIDKVIESEFNKPIFLISNPNNDELRDFVVSGGNPKTYGKSDLDLDAYFHTQDYESFLIGIKIAEFESKKHVLDKGNFNSKVQFLSRDEIKINPTRGRGSDIHMFSIPVYNKNKNYMLFSHKLISMGHSSPIEFYLYKKENDEWKLEKKVSL